jgi:hypothetical protein
MRECQDVISRKGAKEKPSRTRKKLFDIATINRCQRGQHCQRTDKELGVLICFGGLA